MTDLTAVSPREVAGRDTIARFRAQFAAAAYASLQILDAKGVDRVYCDFHDDFVVRHTLGPSHVYHFYQVKTKKKKNHQWTLAETAGIIKRNLKRTPTEDDLAKVRDSFSGKLLVHSINFGVECASVTLITNVHFHDDVEELLGSLQKDGDPRCDAANFLITRFHEIYEISPLGKDETLGHLRKLHVRPNVSYVNPTDNDFESQAGKAIFRYSEIDLTYSESREIARDLVRLIHDKSFEPIAATITTEDFEKHAGVSLDDLLKILSISKTGYEILLQGGDEKALKTASIIERKLKLANAPQDMVEYCTAQKVAWDVWVRDVRHSVSELAFNVLLTRLTDMVRQWNGQNWGWVLAELRDVADKAHSEGLPAALDAELLLGGFFATLVRTGAL
jgi:hypothetical protein